MLVFGPEEFEKSITVTTLNDTIAEGWEYFFLLLTLPETQNQVVLMRDKTIINIKDNDSELCVMYL